MYGTTDRLKPNPPYKHKTQVLQIDKDFAIELIKIFNNHFELKVANYNEENYIY